MDSTALFLLSAGTGERVFGLDMQTVFSTGANLLNAIFLAVVLSYILYRPVQNFLRKRAERIKLSLDRAADDMAKANELKAQYEKDLGNVDKKRVEILEAAHKLANDNKREITNEAKKEADAIREQAQLEIKREQEQISEALRLHIIDISTLMAQKFVSHSIDKEQHDRLFAEAIKELEETAWPS